ncbi:MAG: NAD-dependent epimerase/dehydratase family protein [Methylocystis sp.]
MKQKVFITGGAGFIGSLLAVTFIRRGWDVVAYDSLRSFVQPHERADYPRRLEYRLRRVRQAEEENNGGAQFKSTGRCVTVCRPEP